MPSALTQQSAEVQGQPVAVVGFLAFKEYVGQITRLEETRKRIADRLEAVAGEQRYETKIKTLRTFKGIGTLTALSFIVEIGDFRRFVRAEQFMAFLNS